MNFADIENAARAQGWTVERTERGHRRLIPPDRTKPIVIGGRASTDYKAARYFLADAKRSGLTWPWPPR